MGGTLWTHILLWGVQESNKACCGGRFRAGSVSQREGGNDLCLVSGFHRNGNPNIGLQQLEDCRCPKARIVPKLSECGFLGSLLIVTKQFLSSKLYKLLRKWVFLKQRFRRRGRTISWVSGWRQAVRLLAALCARVISCLVVWDCPNFCTGYAAPSPLLQSTQNSAHMPPPDRGLPWPLSEIVSYPVPSGHILPFNPDHSLKSSWLFVYHLISKTRT